MKIGDIDYTVDSSIGVRQGSCEGPVLFLFIMQAAIETLVWPEGVEKPQFRTRLYRMRCRQDPVEAAPGGASATER